RHPRRRSTRSTSHRSASRFRLEPLEPRLLLSGVTADDVAAKLATIRQSPLFHELLEPIAGRTGTTYDDVFAGLGSEVQSVLAGTPASVLSASNEVRFGVAFDREVSVAGSAFVEPFGIDAVALSTGYNFGFDFIKNQWKLSRGFEYKLTA